jgi:hypothetical protein
MYGPPGEYMKLGTPSGRPWVVGPLLYWYPTPGPLNATTWGLSASRFGSFTMCWGAVVLVVEDEGEVVVELGGAVELVVRAPVVVVAALGAEGWAFVVVGRLC